MFHASISFQRYQFALDAELHLEKGSITALVGASGSGKSSLFRLLCGLEAPLTGKIFSEDVCWFDASKKINLSIQNRKVGLVFQDYALFEHLTVYENIAYGVEKTKQAVVVADWMQRIDLTHKANAYPQHLSGGEKQRVALARVLATSPDILLLDEPFSALDSAIRHDLRRELQALIVDAQIPVLIATHDLTEARFLADAIYVLADGKVIQHGPVASVFKKPETIQAAKVLGWQNILLVDLCEGDRIKGKWGELDLKSQDSLSEIRAVAIPHDALTFDTTPADSSRIANSLSVKLTHSVDMGDHYLVEAQLTGGNRITLKILTKNQGNSPVVGVNLPVYVDLSRIIPLFK